MSNSVEQAVAAALNTLQKELEQAKQERDEAYFEMERLEAARDDRQQQLQLARTEIVGLRANIERLQQQLDSGNSGQRIVVKLDELPRWQPTITPEEESDENNN